MEGSAGVEGSGGVEGSAGGVANSTATFPCPLFLPGQISMNVRMALQIVEH